MIAATDTHSLDQYNAECRTILQISKGIEFSEEDEFDLTYKSYEEVVDMFKQQGVVSEEDYLETHNWDSIQDMIECKKISLNKVPFFYETIDILVKPC